MEEGGNALGTDRKLVHCREQPLDGGHRQASHLPQRGEKTEHVHAQALQSENDALALHLWAAAPYADRAAARTKAVLDSADRSYREVDHSAGPPHSP